MMRPGKQKIGVPLVLFFIIINAVAVLFQAPLAKLKMDHAVIIVANLLLFLISFASLLMQLRSVNSKNPHVMVRGVMGSMALKLVGLGAATFVYIYIAGSNKSVNAILASMGLYIVYTWLEVRIFLRLNPKKNAGN